MDTNNNIYLKIVGSSVFAYGDEQSLVDAEKKYKTGKYYDKVVPVSEWEKNQGIARLVNGEIILGYPEDIAYERNAEIIRYERYLRLRQCDKMSPMHWNALTDAQKQAWTDYRVALLNVPQQEGFPWGGDISVAPWPEKPDF